MRSPTRPNGTQVSFRLDCKTVSSSPGDRKSKRVHQMGNWEEEMEARMGAKRNVYNGPGAEERDCRLCILQIRSGIFRSSGNAKFPLVNF